MAKAITPKGRIVKLKDGSYAELADNEVLSPAGEVLVKDAKGFAGPDTSGNYWCPPNALHPNGAWFPHENDAGYEHPGGTIYTPKPDGRPGDLPDQAKMGAYRWPR